MLTLAVLSFVAAGTLLPFVLMFGWWVLAGMPD